MSIIRYWSDLHLGHDNAYKFASYRNPKERMREFKCRAECEELMIKNYNEIVKTNDIVYFLGDICFNKDSLKLLKRMQKGSKRLIMGNHDNKEDVKTYREYFDKIYGVLYFNKIKAIGSHVPLHPKIFNKSNGESRFLYNIHGHTHDSFVINEKREKDIRYLNCSVEVVNYKPVTLEELKILNNK